MKATKMRVRKKVPESNIASHLVVLASVVRPSVEQAKAAGTMRRAEVQRGGRGHCRANVMDYKDKMFSPILCKDQKECNDNTGTDDEGRRSDDRPPTTAEARGGPGGPNPELAGLVSYERSKQKNPCVYSRDGATRLAESMGLARSCVGFIWLHFVIANGLQIDSRSGSSQPSG